MKNTLLSCAFLAPPNLDSAIMPIYDFLSWALPTLLVLIFTLGAFVCIGLGVQFVKADESGNREKAKKNLMWSIIGFASIFVLIGVIMLAKDPLIEWVNGFIIM